MKNVYILNKQLNKKYEICNKNLLLYLLILLFLKIYKYVIKLYYKKKKKKKKKKNFEIYLLFDLLN